MPEINPEPKKPPIYAAIPPYIPNQSVKININAALMGINATPIVREGLMIWEIKRDNHASNVLMKISPITRMRNEYVGRETFFINNHYPPYYRHPYIEFIPLFPSVDFCKQRILWTLIIIIR